MSRDLAMSKARELKAIMERHGVRCSIELQQGRPWSAYDGWYTPKFAIVNHHTAGARSGNTPSLALCKRGRSDLPGPLCNGYGGRDKVYRILTMGLANHPGQGGPLTVAGYRIPKDSARISTWGTEWEHTGVDPWPDDMKEFMGRSNAALLEWLDRPVEASVEHSTWTARKIDRNGYTARDGQREIERWMNSGRAPATKPQPSPTPPPPEDDMPTAADLWNHKVKMPGQKAAQSAWYHLVLARSAAANARDIAKAANVNASAAARAAGEAAKSAAAANAAVAALARTSGADVNAFRKVLAEEMAKVPVVTVQLVDPQTAADLDENADPEADQ